MQCEAGGCDWGSIVNVKAELVEAMMSAVKLGSSEGVHGNEHCY